MYLVWDFARYECRVSLLMLSLRSSLYSSNAVVSVATAARSVVCHCQKWNSESMSRWPSSANRNFFKAVLPGHDSHDSFLDLVFVCILPVNRVNQQYCILMSATIANRMSDPARTHHFGLRVQNFENPIFMLRYLSLNGLYSSDRLHRTNRFC